MPGAAPSNHKPIGGRIVAKVDIITAEYVRQLLDYNPKTGEFTWKSRTPDMFEDYNPQTSRGYRSAISQCKTFNTRFSNQSAGCLRKDKYLRIRINDRLYYGHRLAWLIIYGEWPKGGIDHRNGIENGNGIANLRLANQQQNLQNQKLKRKGNTSGYKGVSWSKIANKWHAYIMINRKRIHLGYFNDITDAHSAYLRAKQKYHTFQPFLRDD